MTMSKYWYADKATKSATRAFAMACDAAMAITTGRQLARKAGLSHGHMALVLTGQRKATPEVAEAVAAVLDEWGASCTASAKAIRETWAKAVTLKTEADKERDTRFAERDAEED